MCVRDGTGARRSRLARLVTMVMLTAVGCAGTKLPAGYRLTATESLDAVYGCWIELAVEDDGGRSELDGELIAVSVDTLWILTEGGGAGVATSTVREGTLHRYDAESGRAGAGTLLGILSTTTNGYFLVFTAPMWFLGGLAATGSRRGEPRMELPESRSAALRPFARFPQGLPDHVTLEELRLHPAMTGSTSRDRAG